jgi:hypothetical protein
LGIYDKLVEKSPLAQNVVKAASSLSPLLLQNDSSLCLKRFRSLVKLLASSGWITHQDADAAKEQLFMMYSDSQCASVLQNFNVQTDRLDDFYTNLFSGQKVLADCEELQRIVRLILMFSHGQASVESGFSVNKSLLVENLSDRGLIAQRVVHEAIRKAGSVSAVEVTARMLQHVRAARSRCDAAREEQRKIAAQASQKTQNRKRQREITEKLEEELRAKRQAAEAALEEANELQKKLTQ